LKRKINDEQKLIFAREFWEANQDLINVLFDLSFTLLENFLFLINCIVKIIYIGKRIISLAFFN
jgi:hypothetical protein